MATLRLFANLRETAGTTSVAINGTTVGEVLDEAVTAYGNRFAEGLESAQVWVNGDPADRKTAVAEGDEIAVIPPVSGGAVATRSPTDVAAAALVLALAATLVIGNLADVAHNEAFAVAVVGVGVAWLWDLRDAYRLRGGSVRIIPAMLAVAAAANGAYRWGTAGLAGGVAVGIGILLIWAVLDSGQRSIDAVSVSLLLGSTASVGAGALVIVRLRSPAEAGTFLAIAGAAATAAWLVQRTGSATAPLDPNVAGLLAGIAAAAISGYFAETVDMVNALLAGALAGGGFIAGRTIGAAVRMGNVLHTVRGPGLLTAFDGPIAAASIFWIALLLVT